MSQKLEKKVIKEETSEERRKRIEAFMEEASRRVANWPSWKRNVGMMDKDRQYNRYEPESYSSE